MSLIIACPNQQCGEKISVPPDTPSGTLLRCPVCKIMIKWEKPLAATLSFAPEKHLLPPAPENLSRHGSGNPLPPRAHGSGQERGKRLASVDLDGTVKVWEALAESEVALPLKMVVPFMLTGIE